MRYCELFEARTAPLFHFTRLIELMEIVKSDQLGSAEGTSLTRNVNTPYFSHGFFNLVALVIDQDRLAANYKLEPRAGTAYGDDFTLFQKSDQPKHSAKEQEEFIARPIKPLHRYLTHIVLSNSAITSNLLRYMRWAISGKPMPKAFVTFKEMIKRQGHHPLWNKPVLDPANWQALFAYCESYGIVLTQQKLRTTFGPRNFNLWHRDLPLSSDKKLR